MATLLIKNIGTLQTPIGYFQCAGGYASHTERIEF